MKAGAPAVALFGTIDLIFETHGIHDVIHELSRTNALAESLAITRSGLPSPSKSPTANRSPVIVLSVRSRKVPSPAPRAIPREGTKDHSP